MEKDKIIEYLMHTPYNTNPSVLNSLLEGYDNKSEIIAYAMQSSYNMNRMVLEGLISDKPTGVIIYSDTIATTVKAGMSFADYDGTTETLIDSLIVSIEFNGTLYENVVCEIIIEDDISYYNYGDSDLQDYPFYISSWEEDEDNLLYIKTETAGDYTITISTSTQDYEILYAGNFTVAPSGDIYIGGPLQTDGPIIKNNLNIIFDGIIYNNVPIQTMIHPQMGNIYFYGEDYTIILGDNPTFEEYPFLVGSQLIAEEQYGLGVFVENEGDHTLTIFVTSGEEAGNETCAIFLQALDDGYTINTDYSYPPSFVSLLNKEIERDGITFTDPCIALCELLDDDLNPTPSDFKIYYINGYSPIEFKWNKLEVSSENTFNSYHFIKDGDSTYDEAVVSHKSQIDLNFSQPYSSNG